MLVVALSPALLCTPQPGIAQQVLGSADNRISQPTPETITNSSDPVVRPSPTSLEDAAAEQELLELANQRRREAGVPPLRMDASLNEAARAHALLMVERQQLSHQFDGESSLMPRLLEVGLNIDQAGENVAFNSSVAKAFEALMQSPPHRRNLLDANFNVAGMAALWSNGRLYVVQDFAHQAPKLAPASMK